MKSDLHNYLQATRALLLAKLDGLSEYDRRRPMVPSGTNLLGLVKHLVGIEYVYLGTSVGRPPAKVLPWEEDLSVWADRKSTRQKSSHQVQSRMPSSA